MTGIATGTPLAEAIASPYVGTRGDCPAVSSGGYLCTGDAGHELGDLPHVACGIDTGVIAIWGGGREVDLDVDGPGATL